MNRAKIAGLVGTVLGVSSLCSCIGGACVNTIGDVSFRVKYGQLAKKYGETEAITSDFYYERLEKVVLPIRIPKQEAENLIASRDFYYNFGMRGMGQD